MACSSTASTPGWTSIRALWKTSPPSSGIYTLLASCALVQQHVVGVRVCVRAVCLMVHVSVSWLRVCVSTTNSIDDIEDDSKLRRGVPVAHSIYGIPFCINTANYVYFLAMEKCTNLQCPAATRVFLEEMLNLHRGQGWDIMWREHGTCPTEDQYRQMVLDSASQPTSCLSLCTVRAILTRMPCGGLQKPVASSG